MAIATALALLLGACASQGSSPSFEPASAVPTRPISPVLHVQLLDRNGAPFPGKLWEESSSHRGDLPRSWDRPPVILVFSSEEGAVELDDIDRRVLGNNSGRGRQSFLVNGPLMAWVAVVGGDGLHGAFVEPPRRVDLREINSISVQALPFGEGEGELLVRPTVSGSYVSDRFDLGFWFADPQPQLSVTPVAGEPWRPGPSHTKLVVVHQPTGVPLIELAELPLTEEHPTHLPRSMRAATPCFATVPAGSYRIEAWNSPDVWRRYRDKDVFGGARVTVDPGERVDTVLELDTGSALLISYADPINAEWEDPRFEGGAARRYAKLSIEYEDGRALPVVREHHSDVLSTRSFRTTWFLGSIHRTVPLPPGRAELRAERFPMGDVVRIPVEIESGKLLEVRVPAPWSGSWRSLGPAGGAAATR